MLLILGVIAILVLIYLVALVVRSGSGSDAERRDAEALPPPPTSPDQQAAAEGSDAGPAPAAAAYGSASGLRRSFRRARRQLEKHVAGPRPVYGLPWFLVLGAAASHDPDLWRHAGLSLPFGPPDDEALSLEGCNWWLFDGGVLIDVAGDWVLRGDGRSADEKRFGELLALLQRHRPKKPIDGVVLPISSRELLEARRRGHEGLADLEQRAARIYRRLWQTQKQLSIRFPIYVLIVDGQEIPGFHAFCNELPKSFDGEIFGWSSPYSVDAAYQDAWVAEALDAIGARLRQIRTQIFGARPGIGDPDGVFLFPRVLAELAEPLRVFVNQIFKQSAYHESILCRGIYLCGTDEPPGQGARPAAAPAHARHAFFVRDLLERKVFPEGGLARATATALVARHRRVRLAQALLLVSALVLGIGVYFTWVRRDHSRDVFDQVLRRVASDLGKIGADGYDQTLAKTRTLDLLGGMAALDADHFRALFLPTSWLSDFDQKLEDALAQAFQAIVFRSLEREIRDQGHRLTEIDLADDAPPARAAVLREPVALGHMDEFVELDGFVRELALYEEAIATFNRLCTFLPAESAEDQLRDLAHLVRYLFATDLPPKFFESSKLYDDALRRVTHPQISVDSKTWGEKDRARAKFDALVARFIERLFRGNALTLALERLTVDLAKLTRPEFDAAAQEARMRAALASVNRVEDVLADPDVAWAFRSDFDLGPRFDDLVGKIRSSQFLREGAQEVQNATAAGWPSFRRALALSASEITGPHLEVEDGEAHRALSGEAQVLMAALRDFLDQGFMNAGEAQELLRVPPGHRLAWDTLLLEETAALYEPYERFRSKGLAPFPRELRAQLERLARARLGVNMLDLVARAQRIEPVPRAITPLLVEPDLAAEVDDFAAAGDDLQKILGVFERLNLRQARQELADLVADQGMRILEGVDGLLTEEKLYLPLRGGFAWWDGQRPPTLRAFGVADPDELEAYLERQRTRVRHLANDYAQPVITTLGKIGIERRTQHRGLFSRWEAIVAELYAFENKKPGNSVIDLEELIRSDMAQVTLGHCDAARTAQAPRGEPRDYFLERRSRLREGLFGRCRQLAFDHAMTLYARSAAFFNQRLAGRFPFAAGVPGELDPAADPDDLRTFLRDFDAYAGYFRNVPDSLGDGSLAAVQGFVEQMRKVRDFFEPFLAGGAKPTADGATPVATPVAAASPGAAPAAPPAPVFDVDVDFRVNREFESGGDQIIGWTLELGDDRISFRDAQRRGRWELGQPVRLVLRWAQDGIARPATTAPRRGVAVAEREVTFEHRDRWSLLSFVQAHPASREDFRDFADPRPHTLRFVVPTWKGGGSEPAAEDTAENTAPPAAELSQTRVFVRLTVLAPDSKKPLLVPDFPGRAPTAGPAAGHAVGDLQPAGDAPRTETPR